jgi:hypothetical protein
MSDKIKMTAGDSLHISALGPDPLQAGDAFEVDSEADAKRLEAAGHKRAGTSTSASRTSSAPAAARPSRSKRKAAGAQ